MPWGKSDLGIWLRLLIREEKSGNKLSSPPSPQYTMGQSAARILLINPLAPTSYGASIFVMILTTIISARGDKQARRF